MNSNEDNNPARPTTPSESPALPPSASGLSPWEWVRRFIAGNPFYLISAALLHFGINRLSVDPQFFGAEESKLAFNFSALQLYEILLMSVAVILARRRIWYDTALLVVLENLLVLVPFILVTQAALIGRGLAAAFCLAGTILAVVRFGSLKRFIGGLNLPPRLLALGLGLLAMNVAMPLTFRFLIENGTDEWETPSQFGWLLVLPALLGLANTLPAPKNWGGIAVRRGWLPVFLFALWVAASAVHLWCVGYVGERAWHLPLLAPLLWMLAWTAWNRVADFVERPSDALRTGLLVLPLLMTALAVNRDQSFLFPALTALNIVFYATLHFLQRDRRAALQLLLVSGVALLAGMPDAWGKILLPEFDRGRWLMVSVAGYVILQAAWSRHPLSGLCGAMLIAMVPAFLQQSSLLHVCAEIAPAFLLVHSLRWADERNIGAAALRIFAAASWIAHAVVWSRVDGTFAGWLVSSAAVSVWIAYLIAWWRTGRWGTWIVPVGAALAFLAAPTNFLFDRLKTSPAGLLAVAASFLLFGVGTMVALTKERWHHAAPVGDDEAVK